MLLGYLFIYFRDHLFNLFLSNSCWLSFDNFLFLKWLNKKLSNNNFLFNKNFINFSKKFWIKKEGLIFLYWNKWGNFTFLKTKVFLFFKSILLSFDHMKHSKSIFSNVRFSSIFEFILVNCFVNINSLIKLSYLITGLEGDRLQFININYNKFINSNYFFFSNKTYFYNKNILYMNAIKAKSFSNMRHLLKGFKIHCLGRFSRKQRAGSLWYLRGKVPLNTFSISIDYAAYTVPLINSAINVKVWLNVEGRKIVSLFYEAIS